MKIPRLLCSLLFTAILASAQTTPTIHSLSGPAQGVAGGSVQLFVNATGSGELGFQWRRNGEPVPEAHGPALLIRNLQTAQLGSYDVVVTLYSSSTGEPLGSVTSDPIPVTLGPIAGVAAVDEGFSPPEFWRTSLPDRLTAGPNGSVFATFSNGSTINAVGTQISGAVIKLHADGSVDTSFNVGAALVDAWGIVPLADGRVLVGGVAADESIQTGLTLYRVFRLNADGSLDHDYRSPAFTAIPRYMTQQPDGKLLVTPSAGSFSNNGGLSNLVRLNADGSQDTSFQAPTFNSNNPIFAPIALDSQGRILIGGTFNTVNGTARPGVARLLPDGSLDASFVPSGFTFSGPQIRGIAVQKQGANLDKVLVAGGNLLVGGVSRPVIRLLGDGSLDPAFALTENASVGADPNAGRRVRLLNLLPDDRFTVVSTLITRFSADGAVDGGFSAVTLSTEAFWIETLADGRVFLPQQFNTTVNGNVPAGPVRFAADGSLDTTFAPARFRTLVYPLGLAVQPDGKILSWGNYDAVGTTPTPRRGFARFTAAGSLDPLELSGVADHYSVATATPLNDGRFLALVNRGTYQSNLTTALHRFNADGSVDNSFTLAAGVNTSNLRVLPDNRILTWGLTPANLLADDVVLRRLTADGALDTGYTGPTALRFGQVHRDANTVITEIVLGQFRLVGHYADGRALAVATPANGNYPAGAATMPVTLLRLLADGTVDTSFNGPTLDWSTSSGFTFALDPVRNVSAQWSLRQVVGSPFSGAVPQPDGGAIVYGIFTSLGGQAAPGLARLNNTGQVDPNFTVGAGPQFRQRPDRSAIVQQVTLAPDGKLWVAGVFDTFAGRAAPGLVRLNANGSVDTDFTPAIGYTPFITGGAQIGFGAAGEVVLAGTFGELGKIPEALNRLVSVSAPAITTQPASVNVAQGGSATLSVGVTPGLQAAYQWFRNGQALAGATAATLQLTNIQASALGNYTVSVTTALGSVTSAAATVGSSTPAPVITLQPAGTVVVAGGRLLLRAAASNASTYQWMKGGQDIPGATAADFVIPQASANDAGNYSVRASGFGGSINSTAATVSVVTADPVLWQQFSEVSTENSPARILSDGAGKLYLPWTVQAFGPDMVRGRLMGPLVRLHEADGSIDTSFRVDAAIAAVRHIALQPDGRIVAAVSVGGTHRVLRFLADGTTDSTFNSPVFARGLRFVTLQSDGKVLVAATDNLQANPPGGALALDAPTIHRLLGDGSLDPNFTPVVLNAPFGLVFGPPVVDGAGRILLCGGFNTVNGTARLNVARVNADGTLDTTFAASLPAGWASTQGRGVALQSDGRPVFFGDFRYTGRGTSADAIMAVRFNTDGSFDTTFAQPLRSQLGIGSGRRVRWLEMLPDNRMVAVSDRLVRLTADGALDATFQASTLTRETFWLTVGSNGRIHLPDLVGVNVTGGVLPVWRDGLAVFAADGTPVTSFQTGGWGRSTRTDNGVILSDGRVWIGGVFNRYGSTAVPGLAQFTAAGQLTPSQAVFPADSPFGAQLQPFAAIAGAGNDRLYVAFMNASNTNASAYQLLQRLNADGTVDAGFNAELPAGYGLGSSVLHASPGGRLVLSQSFVTAAAALAGNIGHNLLRLQSNGERDWSFNPNLASFAIVERGANNVVTAIRTGGLTVNQILPDGRILVTVAAVDGNLRLQRLLPTGALDESFTPPSFGSVTVSSGFTSVTFDPVTNTSSQFPLYTSSSSGVISAVRQMADGRVYVGATLAGRPPGLVRLLPDGTLDTTFNTGGAGFALAGSTTPTIASIEQDAAGRIYLAGNFDSYNGVAVPGLCRLLPDGTLDAAWSPGVGVSSRPSLVVRLQIVGNQLYLIGPSAAATGSSGNALPTPFRVVTLSDSSSGISAQPLSQSLQPGQVLELFVGVTGSGPYTFQWRRNGVAIPGATSARLFIGAPTAADAGSYDVVVTGPGGQTFTSAAAAVTTSGLQGAFHGIGDLPGGGVSSDVRDATRVGGTVLAVGNATANPNSTFSDTAVLWTPSGGLVALPNLVTNTTATNFVSASAITRDGAYIASRARADSGGLRHAVRVTRDGLVNLNLGGLGGLSGYSAANAISEDGTVLYGFAANTNNRIQAARFETSGPSMTLLPFAAAEYDESVVAGRGISADGSVAVGGTAITSQTNFSTTVAGNRAFRYTHANATTTLLPLFAGGTWNNALGVTPDGTRTLVVGDSSSAPKGEAGLHYAAGNQLVRLGTPNQPWLPSNLAGVTADASVIVIRYGSSTSSSRHTYFRNNHGWFHLHSALAAAGVDLTGWKLNDALGVSPDGTLVFGNGDHNGVREGFVAELPAGFLARFNPRPQSAAGQSIVGTWTIDNAVVMFLPEGIYYHLEVASEEDVAQGGASGFERGTYTWNAATGELRITTLNDTNGDIGLSDLNGRSGATAQVSGDIVSVTIPGEGQFTLQRLLGAPGTLTGGWVVGDPTVANDSTVVVFRADGTFLLASDESDDDPTCRDGLEAGTFTWNPETGAFTPTVTLDLNGDCGLSHPSGQATIQITGGSSAIYTDNDDTAFVTRVGPVQSNGPSLRDQPSSRTVAGGSAVEFRVGATGSGTLTYQWYRNSAAIPGATAANLYLASATSADAGNYHVVVTDAVGSTSSGTASLTLLPVDNVLWQSFTDFSTEFSPARIISNGAGKLYVPWTVQSQIPDMVGGRSMGALVRLNEADGSVDPTFRVDRRIAVVRHAALQSDGRVVAGVSVGDFARVMRFNTDGSTDTSFTSPIFARGVRFVTIQPDGKVLVAAVDVLNPLANANHLAFGASTIFRLNTNGSLDNAFTPVVLSTNGLVFGPPVLDASGRIYLTGSFSTVGGTSRINVARVNGDGTVDPSFAANLPAGWASAQGRGVALQSDGKAVFVGDFRYTGRGTSADALMAVRFNADGSFDNSFAQPLRSQLGVGSGRRLRWLEILPDNTILAISDRIVRLRADGSLDTDFQSRVLLREGFWLTRGTDGRIFTPDQSGVFGATTSLPVWHSGIAAFHADGRPDPSFQTGGWGRVQHTTNGVALPDGRVWMGGNFNRYGVTSVPGVMQFHANRQPTGTVPPVFGNPTAAQLSLPSAIIGAAAGDQIYLSWNLGFLDRVNPDGSRDPAFVPALPSGYVLTGSTLHHAGNNRLLLSQGFVQPQNVLNGSAGNVLLRLNANGTVDTSFTPTVSSFAIVTRDANNAVTMITTGGLNVNQVLPSGGLLLTVAANDGNLRLLRLNPNGSQDVSFPAPSFGPVAVSTGFSGTITDPVTGTTGQFPTTTYTSNNVIRAAHQMASGSVYVGGAFTHSGKTGLIRLNNDGTVHAGFAAAAGSGISSSHNDTVAAVNALAEDSSGRLYVAGQFDSYNGTAVPGLFRLLPDGSLDTAWNPGIGIYPRPFSNVRLQVVGESLYVFGGAAANDALPVPFVVVSIPSALPVISVQPVATTVLEGGSATLSVNVTLPPGSGTATYQWYFNGNAIAGGTGSALFLNAGTANVAGNYHVVVTNAFGSTTSASVAVTVVPSAPVFNANAPYQTTFIANVLPAGTNASLNPNFTAGSRPMTFQWNFNGQPIPGATSESYFVQDWQASESGLYSLTATNTHGSLTSAATPLHITPEGGWRWSHPAPAGNFLTRVSFVNGRFIVGGLRGTLLVSTDGVNWQPRHVPAANNLFGFRYVNGRYFALGSLNLIISSPDTHVWTSHDTGLDGTVSQLQDMTYGGGRFVAVGTNGVTSRSTDGFNWTTGTIGSGVTETIIGITHVLNRFFAVGTGTGRIYSSTDGENWTSTQTPASSLRNLNYGAGRLVAVGNNGVIVTSTDGTNWTTATSGTTQPLIGVDFVNGRFVVTGANGTVLTSLDGVTWTLRDTAGNQSNLQNTAFGNGRYVIVGQSGNTGRAMLTSTDAVTWTSAITGPRMGSHFFAAAASSTTAVAVGNLGGLVSTSDGLAWTERSTGTTQSLNDVVYADSRFLAVGSGGTVLTSLDGATWQAPTVSGLSGATLTGVVHDGAQWVAVASNVLAYTSADGLAWTARSTPAGAALNKLTFAAGQFVAVSANGAIVTSADGQSWTLRRSGDNTGLNDIAHGSGRYVAVGIAGQVATSTNGIDWTATRISNTTLTSVKFIAGHFLATGLGHHYFTSPDGLTWTGRFTGSAERFNDTVRLGDRVLGVGHFGTLMSAGAPVMAGPLSRNANQGAAVVLKASVSESAFPVDYVWRRNGNIIPDHDSPILVIPSASSADAGEYVVTAVNALGSTESAPATLTLNIGVAITGQPQPQAVIIGGNATFNVTATGSPAPTYQWRRNGTDIPGATGATLSLTGVQFTDSGLYSVVVRNPMGSVTSEAVALTVSPPAPVITSPPAATALINVPFSYQITTNTARANYSAAPLPPGLSFFADTGTIAGTPSQAGNFTITLGASNVTGQNQQALQLTVLPPPPAITSPASASGRVGVAFSYTLAATNSPTGFGATGLPAGLSLSGNVISGTPTAAGTFSVQLSAQNATATGSSVLSLTIAPALNAPVATTSFTNRIGGIAGSFFNVRYGSLFTGDNLTFSLSPLPSGAPSVLPAGYTLNPSTGAISGTTSEIGLFPLALTATNSAGSATIVFDLRVNPAATAPVFTSPSSVVGTVGAAFSFTLTSNPAATSFSATNLPPGLALNTSTGVISGQPTQPGILTASVSASNASGRTDSSLSFTINASPNAPVLTGSPLVLGRVGVALTGVQLNATNAPEEFLVLNGSLPDGISLNPATGALTGTPTAPGVTRVWLAARNANGRGPALEIVFTIERALNVPSITSNGTASGQVGRPFLYQITATNSPSSYQAAPLPAGLTFDPASGVISGIPATETSQPFLVQLAATNNDGTGAAKQLAITIATPPATPRITSATSAGGRVGTAFAYQITASASPTSFSATGLPAGLELNSATGAITGTPQEAGRFTVELRAGNSVGLGEITTVQFNLATAPTAPAITSAPTASGQVGVAFSYTVTATATPTSFTLTGALPNGLVFNTVTGELAGIPADEPGLYRVSLTAGNDAGASQPQALLLTIAPSANAPVITSPNQAVATVGAPFAYQIAATNMPASTPFPPSASLDAVGLPAGLAVNPSTGLIAGTPTAVGSYTVYLHGVNESGSGLPRALTLTVNPAPTAPVVTSPASASAQVGTTFTYTITATNLPTSFEALEAPPWMQVNTTTGQLSGVPTAPGVFDLQLRAANAGGASNLAPLTLSVAAAPNTPVVTSNRLASAQVGSAFSYTIVATLSPTSFVATGLPAGLVFNSATGVISGTPTVSGTFSVTISAVNANGQGQPVTLRLTISPSLQITGT